MWLSTSLSTALGLAACALAGIHDQTTTNADGIRSIPVCLLSYNPLHKICLLTRAL
jgi:hypothetical protein